MSYLFKSITCPYCLKPLRSKDVTYVCSKNPTKAIPQSLMDNLFERTPVCNCPECLGRTAGLVCNFCKEMLPNGLFDYKKNMRFSIVGVPQSGKSNFLTTMMYELMNDNRLPFVFEPVSDETKRMFQENVNHIYNPDYPEPVDKTEEHLEMPPPQLWKITDAHDLSKQTRDVYSLTFFDGAGEEYEKLNERVCRYLNGSKCLFILFDPLALPGVKNKVERNIYTWSGGTDTMIGQQNGGVIVSDIARYLRNNLHIKENAAINKEVAIVFSKIDAVKHTFAKGARVMQPSPHVTKKGFYVPDADAVNEEIKRWLIENNETAFLNAIHSNFNIEKVRFFGVSSFGQPPTGENQLARVTPHRVYDPLMWMLANEGIIPFVN